MQDQQPRRSPSPVAIAAFCALLVATGSGVAWWTWKNNSATTTPTKVEYTQPDHQGNASSPADPAKTQKQPAATSQVTTDKPLQVFWLKASGNKIQLVPAAIKLTSSSTPDALLETAMKQLIAGPTSSDLSTTVPAGTQLLGLNVKDDGIHVNLSREFTTGGGSSSMEGRLAQVLYTATSLDPGAPVWLSIEGKPLKTLGGEGLVIEQPVTRKQFEQDFPL